MDNDVNVVVGAVQAALDVEVVRAARLGGGDVAASFVVDLADGRRVFAKTHAAAPPGFFTTEASGLAWLRDADAVRVPAVLGVGDDPPHLVLEWVEEGRASASTEADMGRALASLHAAGAPGFGRADRATTGTRALPNEPCDSWADFFAGQRLVPLARLARDEGAVPESAIADLERRG